MVNRYIEENQPRNIEALGYVDKKNFKGNEYFQFVMDDYIVFSKEDTEIVSDIKDILFNL